MTFHQFGKHPIHVAVLVLLASYAQAAQDLSVNSMTLDTSTGKPLGNVSRRGDMQSFFQVQKEMVFNTLTHLGIRLEDLPPRLRQEIEKPQTTNSQAFTAFAKAVDKADKGQFSQAAKLFNQAAKLDPGFSLAKGMAKLMPAFDLAPGGGKKVLADLKKNAKDEGRKNSEKLADSLDKKEQNLKSKLDKLAKGEGDDNKDKEDESGIKKKLDKLGLSDEGDDSGFDPSDSGETDPNKIETASIGGVESTEPLLLAENLIFRGRSLEALFQDRLPNLELPYEGAEDRQRNAAIETGNQAPPSPGIYDGIFGAVIDGQFVGGSASFSVPAGDDPSKASVDLAPDGGQNPERLYFAYSEGELGDFTGTSLFGVGGEYQGMAGGVGSADAFAAIVWAGQYPGSSLLVALGGTPTPTAKLPSNGVQHVDLDALSTDPSSEHGYDLAQFGALVDWGNNKVFSPAVLRERSEGVLMIGSVNRAEATLDAGAWWTDPEYYPDIGFTHGESTDIRMRLYGGEVPALAGGFLSLQARDIDGHSLQVDRGIISASDFSAIQMPGNTPAQGETWTGFTAGVGRWESGYGFFSEIGQASFTFFPETGEVTGEITPQYGYSLITTTTADPNAFIHKNAFGAKTVNELGTPSYFSTQGDFAGEGWTDLAYASMGYWAHDEPSEGILRFLGYSTWVAGQLTPTGTLDALQQGTADYSGKTLGAVQTDSDGNLAVDLLTGNFSMSVDFGQRGVSGALSDLTRDSDGSVWLANAAFQGGFQEGNGFQADFLDGSNIDTESSYLRGAFFGPEALETGGAWRIVRSGYDDDENFLNEDAAGVFTGKRGAISLPAPSYGGVYAMFGDGVLTDGASGLTVHADHIDFEIDPAPEVMAFQPDSGSPDTGSYSGTSINGLSGTYTGMYEKVGPTEYITTIYNQDISGSRPILVAVNGTPTPVGNLPTVGRQSFAVSGLVESTYVREGFEAITLTAGARVDWANNKVFSQVARAEGSDGVLMLGTVDRDTGTLDVQGWYKDLDGSGIYAQDNVYGTLQDFTVGLFGAASPIAGGGTFSVTERGLDQQVQTVDRGMLVVRDFAAAPAVAYTPATGETWSGYSAGIRYDPSADFFASILGRSEFVFNPGSATVSGGIYSNSNQVVFTTTTTDLNAFMDTNAFGAMKTNALGMPSYYSTQGDFSGEGWTDYRYTSMGYWAHDYSSGGNDYSYGEQSTWVAGQLTPANPQMGIASGSAYYTGKVLGAIQGGDGEGNANIDLLTGGFNMTVNFSDRGLSGAFTDLRRDWDNSPWLDRADFAIFGFSGNTYSGAITGNGIDGESSLLNGSFFGPNAEETGGAWRISKNADDWAAGVYAAKRGDIFTPLQATWAGNINGVFESGSADMHRDSRNGTQSPADLILTLRRAGYGDGSIEYRSYQNSTTYFTYLADALWPDFNGLYQWGSGLTYGTDSYFANFYQTNGADINLTAFGGVRTTEAQLPNSGHYAYNMTALSSDGVGTYSTYGTMGVEFGSNKVFMPAQIDPANDSTSIMLGSLDRANTTVTAQVWSKNSWPMGSNDTNWAGGHVASLSMPLYGSGVNVVGALFNGVDYDYSGNQTGITTGVVSGYTGPWGRYYSNVPAEEGQLWTGYSANLVLDRVGQQFHLGDYGQANFVLHPGMGSVEATITEPDILDASFSNSADDPSAFIGTTGFGGMKPGANGAIPFFYSTRSFDTSWESLPWSARSSYQDRLEYHFMGMWTADSGSFSVLPASTWIAGAQTPSNIMPANGYVRYAGYVSGIAVSSDQTSHDYLSGLFSMTADFNNRSVSGAIENLTKYNGGLYEEHGFDFQGDMNVEAYGGLLPTYQSTSSQGRNGSLLAAGVDGMFYGLSGAEARETGGRWWMDVSGGGGAVGIFSARDRNRFDWSAGVLSDMAEQGVFAVGHPLAAYVDRYNYVDGSEHLTGELLLPGAVGRFNTGDIRNAVQVQNRPYYQWAMTDSDDSSAYVYFSAPTYAYVDFKLPGSIIQFSAEKDFFRFFMVDAEETRGMEGYYGTRTWAWNMPSTGISTYDFHQSSIENGVGNSSDLVGQNGLFPGKLYVNWETGQVYGYNLDPAVEGGGQAMFLGTVNRETGKIEGTYQIRTDRMWAADEAPSSRFAMDASGASLELFGNSGTPSGLGGVFATALQGEDLLLQPSRGQALISGLRDKQDVTPSVLPEEGEVWNGYAVGFATDRSTGLTEALGNHEVANVAITFSPSAGHVHGSIAVGDGGEGAPVAQLVIASDNNPATEAERQAGTNVDSASVYVSPKAFGMVQSSPSMGGDAAPTTEFIAAAPEAMGEAEAARYDYTTWGAWGGDFGTDKNTTVSPRSLWVAGKLTQTADMPQAGSATYTGFVAGQVMGAQTGYVQGQLNMSVNFGERTVGGNMNNLNFNNNPSTPWVAQANLAGGIHEGAATYSALLSGTGVAGGANGAFYGPQAIETGGNWVIQKDNGSQGAGIFAGKRGNIAQ